MGIEPQSIQRRSYRDTFSGGAGYSVDMSEDLKVYHSRTLSGLTVPKKYSKRLLQLLGMDDDDSLA